MSNPWRFLYLACVLAVFTPALAIGQTSSSKVPLIGMLSWSPCEDSWIVDSAGPFFRGLGELGYIPGENIMIVCRSAAGRYENFPAASAELVQLSVDVIVADSEPEARAARDATRTIPIVSIISGDPVAGGLAHSLAKPGGNITGVSYYATELTAKRLELLKNLMPGITTVAVLANPEVFYLPFEADAIRAADRLGITPIMYQIKEPADLETAFARMKTDNAQAVFVLPDLLLADEAPRIAELALEHRLPTMSWGSWYTQVGGLMAYSTNYGALAHRLAFYVDRILKGEKPGDLPIEQPTTYALSINLKTADAIGVAVPESLLLLADEVIE